MHGNDGLKHLIFWNGGSMWDHGQPTQPNFSIQIPNVRFLFYHRLMWSLLGLNTHQPHDREDLLETLKALQPG
jgi:hypothetical protein